MDMTLSDIKCERKMRSNPEEMEKQEIVSWDNRFSENARTVLQKRYLAKDENGKPIETIEGMFRRVASAIAKADLKYDKNADTKAVEDTFFEMMVNREFMPNSPTLMNAGRPLGQLSACFVLPVGDSMEEIFDSIKHAALIHKSGGGTGFSFSRLRPSGSAVYSTGGVASGPVSFMKVFDAATEAVKQGGTRRGANMGILRVDHPDILEFIDCKSEQVGINNFNISVAITDAFMKALEDGQDYALMDPHTGRETGRLDAKLVFDKIVHAAWKNGEPGIVFIDRMNAEHPLKFGEIEATNPCGEQPLLPYEACNLGSINLSVCTRESDFQPGFRRFELDEDRLQRIARDAVHFLDNVIDVNRYPLPQIEELTRQTRKIGLGVMGFADLLLKLGIPYDSEEGVEMAERIMSVIRQEANKASAALAQRRGNFPAHHNSIFETPMRNATRTTIAPTGTISIICDASSGCEPVFAFAFTKNVMDGEKLIVGNPILEARLKEAGIYSPELMEKIMEQGSVSHIEEIPEDIRRVFVCAHDISPEWHVRMQAAFQFYTDNAVSKTINFPSAAAEDEVRNAYLLAYELGCKGLTVYRDGSRDGQVLTTGQSEKKEQDTPKEPAEPVKHPTGEILPRPRPELVSGITRKVKIGCGSLFITVNSDEHGICEVFTSTGKNGGCPSQSEAVARLTSVALRSGIAISEILAQLKGIRCPSTIRQPGMSCTSCPDAIARTIEEVLKKQRELPELPYQPMKKRTGLDALLDSGASICPECGQKLRHEGGCVICDCGFSHCG